MNLNAVMAFILRYYTEGITFESYVEVVAAKHIFQHHMIYGDICRAYRQRVH